MKIIGPIQPNIGENVQYMLSGSGLSSISNNGSALHLFELYQKRRNGEYISTNITNNTGTFLFGEIAANQELKLIARDPSTNEKLGELEIVPQKGTIGEIHDVGLRFTNNDSSDHFSTLDKVEAVAHTTNLVKRTLIFELYNEDEGSEDETSEPLATKEAIVGNNGTAVAEFNLAKILLNVPANSNEGEDLNRFYVKAKRKPPVTEDESLIESTSTLN